jgi:hypothetical protein
VRSVGEPQAHRYVRRQRRSACLGDLCDSYFDVSLEKRQVGEWHKSGLTPFAPLLLRDFSGLTLLLKPHYRIVNRHFHSTLLSADYERVKHERQSLVSIEISAIYPVLVPDVKMQMRPDGVA